VLDYVDAALRTWGIARRRLDAEHTKWLLKPDKTRDKIPASGQARSFMGRLTEGGHVGRGKDGSPAVEPLDGLTGDALTASLALQLALLSKTITERQYQLCYVEYAVKARKCDKRRLFRLGHAAYHTALHNLQVRLSGWLRTLERRQIA
jgi:hypothetical protein